MSTKIQSAGGIIYFIDQTDYQPKFLILKRMALSKKIEWVAPKGKLNKGETPEETVIREIGEEVGIPSYDLRLRHKIGDMNIYFENDDGTNWDKDIAYYLVKFSGEPTNVKVADGEGFIGIYKWATIKEIMNLVKYKDLRQLFKEAYDVVLSAK